MTVASRIDMCKAVAQDVDWPVSAAEFPGAEQCGKAMVAKYHHESTVIISVRKEAKLGGISQKGDNASVLAQLGSTQIRAVLAQQDCTSKAVDNLVRRKILLPAVGECLKRKFAGEHEPDEEHEEDEENLDVEEWEEEPPELIR